MREVKVDERQNGTVDRGGVGDAGSPVLALALLDRHRGDRGRNANDDVHERKRRSDRSDGQLPTHPLRRMLPAVGAFLVGYGLVKGNSSAVKWGVGMLAVSGAITAYFVYQAHKAKAAP
jgi:hypothetical protein